MSGRGSGYDVAGFKPLHKGRLREGVARVYADGGSLPSPMLAPDGQPVLDKNGYPRWHVNPSIRGFTWAWVLCDEHDQFVRSSHGYVLCPITVDGRVWPAQTDMAEFYALTRALSQLPLGWSGEVATDNLLTIHRMFHQQPIRSVPPSWARDAAKFRAALMAAGGLLTPIHLRGHPKVEQLAQGHDGTAADPGIPTSRWNVRADDLCQLARKKAEAYLDGRTEAEAAPRTGKGTDYTIVDEPVRWDTDGPDPDE